MSRIIAGTAGGRRLTMPPGAATRPTSERAREGLFSTLASVLGSLVAAPFLDLYAGSGAVGLEAASRGAGPVTLVESDHKALRALRANVEALELPGITVREGAVGQFLAGEPTATFQVVFADPPYSQPVNADLERLVAAGWLAPDALVCLERASRDAPIAWPDGLVEVRSRRYGDTTLWYGRAS
jgi:16S rRNA (guanine966-N2)-methyltransferase